MFHLGDLENLHQNVKEAYEQKIYTGLINYQFQVASRGWGCL